MPAPRPMPPPTAAIRQVALGQGEFIEGHELDRKWRVPKEMIGRRLSQEEAKSGQLARVSTAKCTRSRCEKVFEDILAIHRGERLFTNFTVHQPAGRLGLCLYTHHLVVRATFRAFEISGDVSGGHLFTQFERASEPESPRHPPASIGGRARMPGTAGV